MSNRIGKGRSGYWPASEGRLNHCQVMAAVHAADYRYRRIWKVHIVMSAPKIFYDMDKFPVVDWNRDETETIIQNAAYDQWDNWLTLPEADAQYLIELMKWYAQARIDVSDGKRKYHPWERVPDTEYAFTPSQGRWQVHKDGNPLCLLKYGVGHGWTVDPESVRNYEGHGFGS